MEVKAQALSGASEQGAAEDPGLIRTPLLKAAFDEVMALLALVALAPLFVLIALAIKMDGWLHPEDRGPVFYREARVSQGRIFTLYKFRVLKTAVMEAARREKGYDHAKPLERHKDNMTRCDVLSLSKGGCCCSTCV